MARLISRQSGNLTDSATWAVADSGSGAQQTVFTTGTGISTNNVFSPVFTIANGSVVDAVLVSVYKQSIIPATFTVGISDNSSTYLSSRTIDTLDIPDMNGTSNGWLGWVLITLPTTVTGDGTAKYSIGVRASTSSRIAVYRDATSNNWARLLRTTVQGSPVAADDLFIVGELTGQGTGNSFAVTMNETATTDYGAISIGVRGTLQYGSAASTNYYLKTSGIMRVQNGGTLNIGTVATPIPSSSTAVLEFDCTADGEFGLEVSGGGTFVAQGASKLLSTLLTSDVAASATTLPVVDTTGWAAGDALVVASTTRTSTQNDRVTIQTVDSSTQVTLTGGITNAHGGGGTADVVAEVINLTNNVKIRGMSGLMSYVFFSQGPNANLDYVQFQYLGENVAGKRGIETSAVQASYSVNIQNCSLMDFEDSGMTLVSASPGTIIFNNNVAANLNTAIASTIPSVNITNVSFGTLEVKNNVLVGCLGGSGSGAIQIAAVLPAGSCDGNTIVGCNTTGIYFSGSSGTIFRLGNTTIHSNQGAAISGNVANVGIFLTDCKIWRNNNSGFTYTSNIYRVNLENCLMFGNTTPNVTLGSNVNGGVWVLKNCVVRGDSAFSTTYGILFQTFMGVSLYLYNCDFGVGVAHTANDIRLDISSVVVHAFDCVFTATNEFVVAGIGSVIRSHNHDDTVGYHKHVMANGIVESETSIRHTASGKAWRMDPNVSTATATSGDIRLRFPGPTENEGFPVAVVGGVPVTIRTWLRKDSAYAGNAPRLRLVGGQISGISADVIDTMTVGADIWEELEVTATPAVDGVVEWLVECDGTTGYVYLDDATAIQEV